MAKKTSKKTSKKTKKSAAKSVAKKSAKSTPKPKLIRIPTVVGRVQKIAMKLSAISELPDNLKVQRDKLVKSINSFAGRIKLSYARAVNVAERTKAKIKRDAEKEHRSKVKAAAKATRDAIRATAKAKRDAAKAERTKASNARKTEQIKVLKVKLAKLEN